MPFEMEAEEAISELKGERVDGKLVIVRFATLQEKENPVYEPVAEEEEDWDDS